MRSLVISKQITNRGEASIDRYFQEISKYPLIPPEEEVKLAEGIRNGDSKALDALVLGNLRFVVSVAKQYQNQGLAFTDLINEGNLGLVRAASKFDETRGFKFISYAVWWIRQSIMQAISTQNRIVRLPLNRISSINKITGAIPYLEQKFEREPTDQEIAHYLEFKDRDVEIANKIKFSQVSFDKPLSMTGDNEFNLYDLVHMDDIPSPDNRLLNESVSTNIERALKKLSKREATILTMTFGLFETPVSSQEDIANEFDMTTERVRQIRSKALGRLKLLLKGKEAFIA